MGKKIKFIIVLSHLMDKFGNLNQESKKRAQTAAKIYHKYRESKIISSGWSYRSDCTITIAESFKNYLYNYCKVPLDKIITETNSRDTVGDAVFTRKNIISKYIQPDVYIVSSSYHEERVKEIFNFVYGSSSNLYFKFTEIYASEKTLLSEKNSIQEFRKTFSGSKYGNIKDIYKRLYLMHPFYNGKFFNENNKF